MSSLRERTRLAVRQEVMAASWRLFAKQGFEGTTVDQIAAAAGMSRRSFFRYFDGKEELVLERMLETGAEMAQDLRAVPRSTPVWTALRTAFQPVVQAQEDHPEPTAALLIMLREPSLHATIQERQRRWLQQLSPVVAQWFPTQGSATADPRPAAVAGSAIACWEVAQNTWVDHRSARLGALLDEAMSAVAPLAPAKQ